MFTNADLKRVQAIRPWLEIIRASAAPVHIFRMRIDELMPHRSMDYPEYRISESEVQMMSQSKKRFIGAVLLLILILFQVAPTLARSDNLIQSEIETQIAESPVLRGTLIDVQVEQQLVILSGEVRLYEQKLVSSRIAWTTAGVFEVDNEVRVVPKLPLSDAAIELKIWEIVKADERFRIAGLTVRVNNGEVFLKGRFIGFRDPSVLKHKVAAIEGVVDIRVNAEFLARSSRIGGGARGNPAEKSPHN